MRYLLDAHTLLWSQDDINTLSATATAALSDPTHDRLVSIATVWEIGIKVAIGKLPLSKPFRSWMDTALTDLAATVLPATPWITSSGKRSWSFITATRSTVF